MKKVISLLLCACMIFTSMVVLAAPEAKTYGSNITVYGELAPEREGDDVSILMYDTDTTLDSLDRVLHVGMTKVQYGGEYQYKFKYTIPEGKTIENYTIKAKIGADDISDTIISVLEDKINAFDVSVRMDAYFTPEVTITNKHEDITDAKVIVASYTDAGELVGTKIVDTTVPYDQEGEGYVVNIADIGGDYVKAFLWDDEISPIPLAKNDRTKTTSDTKFKDGDVVSITGSSSVHLSTAPTFIDHFYQTRYPDIDVTIYNTGVGGDRVYMVLDRLDWDVYYGNPNKLYLLCGGNDVKYWEYGVGKEELTEDKIEFIYNSYDNYQKFINTMREDGKDFVFLGTALYDEGDYRGATYGDDYYIGSNKAIGIINGLVKDLAEKENIKNIDFFNYTTQITDTVRATDPTSPVLSSNDRVHLTDHGYLVEGALILLAQGNDEVVATVDINVDDVEKSTYKNAVVEVTEATDTKVTYNYAPKSIPLANGTWYKEADKLYPITEKLNQEIIKVTGLEEGTYTIKFTDEAGTVYTLGSYTSANLAKGVNIAINDENPGQIQSMEAMAKQVTRRNKEKNVRSMVADEVEAGTQRDPEFLAKFNAGKDEAQSYAAQAKALSVPKTYTVTIEKQ